MNAKGQETVREYDALDRKFLERDALGNFTRFSYDPNSNLVRSDTHEQVTDPNTGATREEVFSALYEYDELNRRISTTDGLGNTTRFSYDSRDSLIRQVDPLGNVKRFEYDVYGRKVSETTESTVTGLGGGAPVLPHATTRSEYDDNGNLTASIDAEENRTEQEFDALDRQAMVQYPDATTQRFQYDPDDHVIADEDNNGLRRLYTFDALDSMIRMDLDRSGLAPNIIVEGASFAQFGYDGLRRVVLERNDFAETHIKVDSLARRYEEAMSFATPVAPSLGPLTLLREFDNLGNLIQLTYPGGRQVRYDLDPLNRIVRIENMAKGSDYPGSATFPDSYEILQHQYRGLRKRRALRGNSASTTYEYDGNARIIQIAHAAPGESLILQHLYDAAGNMRFKNDVSPAANLRETYKYDSFYWLTKRVEEDATNIPLFDPSDFAPADASKPRDQLDGQARIDAVIGPPAQDPGAFTFKYDLTGNREEERESGQTPITYVPNILNQYAAVEAQPFSYDRNGNLNDDGRRQYVYDYQNRLVLVHEPSTGDAQFFYDAQGRRICNATAGQATYLVSDGQNVIEEYRAGTLVAQYVKEYGLDTTCQMARRDSAARPGNEYWYHNDLVRSSRMLTDATGSVRARYRYSPFGEPVALEPRQENPYRFMGRRLDTPLDVYDFRTREYSPTIGRFLQRDIVTASNLYIFVGNNPLGMIDPTGTERKAPSEAPSVFSPAELGWEIGKGVLIEGGLKAPSFGFEAAAEETLGEVSRAASKRVLLQHLVKVWESNPRTILSPRLPAYTPRLLKLAGGFGRSLGWASRFLETKVPGLPRVPVGGVLIDLFTSSETIMSGAEEYWSLDKGGERAWVAAGRPPRAEQGIDFGSGFTYFPKSRVWMLPPRADLVRGGVEQGISFGDVTYFPASRQWVLPSGSRWRDTAEEFELEPGERPVLQIITPRGVELTPREREGGVERIFIPELSFSIPAPP